VDTLARRAGALEPLDDREGARPANGTDAELA
jgi:hypothetical protein